MNANQTGDKVTDVTEVEDGEEDETAEDESLEEGQAEAEEMENDDDELDPDDEVEDATGSATGGSGSQKNTSGAGNRSDDLAAKVAGLETELRVAHDQELRATADYQNLHRRTQEDRNKMARLASREVIENILQPLDHLFLAQAQLKDKGLDIVCQQFQQVLQDQGLEEIPVLGKKVEPEEMEVIDQVVVEDKKQLDKVVKVTQKGYRLNGEIIRHAKVVIGTEK